MHGEKLRASFLDRHTPELHVLHAPLLCFGYASRCYPRKMFRAAVNTVIVFIVIITSLRE